jgi:PAS domain S-box-containing protein
MQFLIESPEHIPEGQMVIELADLVPHKILLLDPEGRFLFVNRMFAQWIGVKDRSTISGRRFDELVQASVPIEEIIETISRLAETGDVGEFELQITRPDSAVRCVSVRMVGHPNRIGAYAFLHDITDERESIAIAARLKAVVETAADSIIVIDATGIIRDINPAGLATFGYSADEVVGKNIKMLVPKQRHVIGGTSEAQGLRKDGSIFPCDLSVAEFINAGETFFTGIIRDITERKHYEERMIANEAHLEEAVRSRSRTLDQIYNVSDDILGIVDHDSHFVSISPSAERILGIPPSEIVLRPFFEFVHLDDQARSGEVYHRARKGEPISGFENRLVHVDGTVRWVMWNLQPVVDEATIVVIGRDVTDEKLREETLRQSQKMEAIGQLTGGIAHDFNNLLAAISGSLEIMGKRIEQGRIEQLGKYIDAGRQASGRAAQLTQRLLAFARRQPLSPVPVNPNDLVASMEDLFDRSVGPGISLRTDLKASVWNTVCDPNQLESSLLNCIVNAKDAMPGGGEIIITTNNITEAATRKHRVPKGEWVLISVSDVGSGMPEDIIARAFDPFFTTKPIGQGTGLGLSMLYGFVSQSGGHVRIDSKVNEGTTISIYLPRHAGEFIPALNEDHCLPKLAEPGQTILVVEDEPLVREVLIEIMESSGYKTFQAEDADHAIPIIASRDHRIDLLLSDVGLPGMNGRQLAEIARQHRPDLKVLFITGYAPNATLRNEFLGDNMDMMAKPFEVDQVVTRVASILRNQNVPDNQNSAIS